jgi:hypothetical protein
MMLDRRDFLERAAFGATLLVPSANRSNSQGVARPEDFGARGNGKTNDTDAFAALSNYVNERGGGTVELAKEKTYIVGRQVRSAHRYFLSPLSIMRFERLRQPLRINGNGARLLAEPGLMFGIFDETSSKPLRLPRPNFRAQGIAAPYDAMIWVSDCLAPIEIRNLELDGNLERMIIGGGYGDTGHQLPGSGLVLADNESAELISNIHSHHHPLDGVILNGSAKRRGRSRFYRLITRYNGRQGVSVVGGNAQDFIDCEFSHTGRSALFSAPGAGVDVEAEGKQVRDVTFRHCRFIANAGPGLLADQGNSKRISCTNCTLIGTTSWSAWPNKPEMRFQGCEFVGAVANPFASADATEATQFHECLFRDDPALAPGGVVFFNDRTGSGPIVDLGGSGGNNVLFSGCTFRLTHRGRLPWSWHAIYADNIMSQASRETGYPRGIYKGRNVITGQVDLYSSTVSGELIVNGRRQPS